MQPQISGLPRGPLTCDLAFEFAVVRLFNRVLLTYIHANQSVAGAKTCLRCGNELMHIMGVASTYLVEEVHHRRQRDEIELHEQERFRKVNRTRHDSSTLCYAHIPRDTLSSKQYMSVA